MDGSDVLQSAANLLENHRASMAWLSAYLAVKIAARLAFKKPEYTVAQTSALVWDPVCLVHNVLSVCAGFYSVLTWDRPPEDACSSINDMQVLVLLLQACHAFSDFLVFWPSMAAEPVFIWHHAVLIVVSLILPQCQGCFYVVIAFSIAEFGSGAIAVDAEWRKTGGQSRGLKRVVIFGLSRLVNVVLLYQIWLVTPTVHEFKLTDTSDESFVVKFNVPVCLITSVGGSLMMLCVNGLTWWRMWKAYLRQLEKRRQGSPKSE